MYNNLALSGARLRLALQDRNEPVTKTATAAVLDEAGGPFRLRPVQLGPLRADEVLVRIQACGICHTDLKFQERLPLPAVFGHEGTGVVEEVGAQAKGARPGDRVMLSYPWCGQCPSCVNAEPYCCEAIPKLKFGGRRLDGSQPIRCNGAPITSAFFQQSSFATHAIAHAHTLVPVQTDLPPERLAALPCGVQTGAGAVLNTFAVGTGDPLAVIGAGTVGLSAILAGKLVGATPLIAVDLVPSRLALALELGATHAFHAGEEDVAARVREAAPQGARFVLDTSDSLAGLNTGVSCLGQGGVIGIVSAPPSGAPFPFSTRGLFERVGKLQCIVQGSSVPQKFLPRLLRLHEQGRFPYDRLVTAYEFAAINEALADIKSGKAIKPVLVMSES